MPDSVRIGITSDYTGTGVSQAMADLGGLEKFARQSSVNMAQIDATQAKARAALAATGSTALTFGEKWGIVSGMVGNAVNGIATGLTKFSIAAVGMGVAAKKGFEFLKSGAELDYTRDKFDRLARSVGTTSDVFMRELRVATKGTISEFELLKQGSDLLQLGLAKDSTEAVRLSKVMTALGMDTGELTLALANQSKRRLDQLGLSLSKFNEIEARLKDAGMTKDQAFKEAFLQTAEETVVTTGNRADSAMGDYLKFQAALQTWWQQAKEQTGKGGFWADTMRDATRVFQAMGAVQRGEMEWTGNLFQLLTQQGPALRPREYFEQAVGATPQTAGFGVVPDYGAGGRGRQQILRPEDYAQLREFYSRGGAGGGGAAVAESIPDYKNLLDVGLDITKMTEDYKDKTVELNDKLTEQREVLAELEKKHKTSGEQYLDQLKKIVDTEAAIDDLGKSAGEAYDKMTLGAIKNRDATEEQQLQFAYASGMITEEAFQQASAIDKIAEAFTNNELSAGAAAAGVNGVMAALQMYDGLSVAAYIDVYVRTHGGGGINIPPPKDVGGSGTLGSLLFTGQGQAASWLAAQGKWTGGMLSEGFTIVGDMPGGGWGPWTEVIGPDGWVYTAEEARALKRAGLLAGATAMREGTEGYQGSYYTAPRVAARRFTRTGSRTITGRAGSTSSGGTTAQTEDVAAIAATVSEQAVSTAQAAIAAQQSTQNNMQVQTHQTVQATQQSSQDQIDELREIQRLLKKLPDADTMYAVFKTAGQQSI